MEGVMFLMAELEPVGFAEHEALDCFSEAADFTIVMKKIWGTCSKVFLQENEEEEDHRVSSM